MEDKEQELLDSGKWKREWMALHIQEIDKTAPKGVRRLSYDMGDTFTGEQISSIERFVREVNRRFPNIKMYTTGTGLIPTGKLGEAAEEAEKSKCTDPTGEKPADTATYK